MIGILWMDLIIAFICYALVGQLLRYNMYIPASIWMLASVMQTMAIHVNEYHKEGK